MDGSPTAHTLSLASQCGLLIHGIARFREGDVNRRDTFYLNEFSWFA